MAIHLKVVMQIYVKRGDKVLVRESKTVGASGELTLAQVAVGVIAGLVDTWCVAHQASLEYARGALDAVKDGIATMHYEPTEEDQG